MRPIELLFSRNVISRKRHLPQQEVFFLLRVTIPGYEKKVEIHWTGEEGFWHVLFAEYIGPSGRGAELWKAGTRFFTSEDTSFPGDLTFAVKLVAEGKEYWDDNGGANYRIDADSGILPRPGLSLVNADHHSFLEHDQKIFRISAAVDRNVRARAVGVRWSADGWRSYHDSPLEFVRNYWDRALDSNARNPNKYGCTMWRGRVRIDDAYRLDYSLFCDTPQGRIWDANGGDNYFAHRGLLRVLTLNLHCYQEADQETKFDRITRAIQELGIDIVCLQEVGENWNGGQGDWDSNAAKVLKDRLKERFHIHTDWAHQGFSNYREGVAILSRFPVLSKDAGYVSKSHDIYDINARKAVFLQLDVPFLGRLNVFSTHLSWMSGGFNEQFECLRSWAHHRHHENVAATLVCGDFNAKAGSSGYSQIVLSNEFEDMYLEASAPSVFEGVFRHRYDGWEHSLASDHRIDYIFKRRGSRLKPAAARELFTDSDYGRVSDHTGYLVEFEVAP